MHARKCSGLQDDNHTAHMQCLLYFIEDGEFYFNFIQMSYQVDHKWLYHDLIFNWPDTV